VNAESLRVLGIDPGLQRTGYACVEVKPGSLDTRLVEAGLVRLKASAPIRALSMRITSAPFS
jgi:Holliday junction resolvasome RuvABC endonuclease subunit